MRCRAGCANVLRLGNAALYGEGRPGALRLARRRGRDMTFPGRGDHLDLIDGLGGHHAGRSTAT